VIADSEPKVDIVCYLFMGVFSIYSRLVVGIESILKRSFIKILFGG